VIQHTKQHDASKWQRFMLNVKNVILAIITQNNQGEENG
jgi:hypothetical protein